MPDGALFRAIGRLVDFRRGEGRALILSAAYFFFVLSAYYVVRPIRDDMAIAGGVRNLPWLFTGTLLAMLAVQPIFGGLVAKFPRARFVPYCYRFFMACLLLFFALLQFSPAGAEVWVGRAFYIWVSVFNLFVVSVFWSFMADTFRTEQGKRLFPVIAVGGTVGAMSGSAITALFVDYLGAAQLMFVSILLLELAVRCVKQLGRMSHDEDLIHCHKCGADITAAASDAPCPGCGWVGAKSQGDRLPVGGGALDGIRLTLASPYLLGIALYMFLYTTLATYLYFQQVEIFAAVFEDRGERIAALGWMDFTINALTVLTQLFLTGRLMKWLGVGVTLAILPLVCIVGFASLGFYPTLAALIAFQVFRRASNYAISRPSREVLYTVLPREQKYKAKNFIDTFVYRGGDQIGAWTYELFTVVGLGMAAIAFIAAPIAGLWLMTALWLGRRQQELAAR